MPPVLYGTVVVNFDNRVPSMEYVGVDDTMGTDGKTELDGKMEYVDKVKSTE